MVLFGVNVKPEEFPYVVLDENRTKILSMRCKGKDNKKTAFDRAVLDCNGHAGKAVVVNTSTGETTHRNWVTMGKVNTWV